MQCLRSKKVKIRKPHRCLGCARVFQPGTEMSFEVVVDQGDIWSNYLCDTCDAIAAYYDNYDGSPENFAVDMKNDHGFKMTMEDFLDYLKANEKTIAEISKSEWYRNS